jgi:hypothetical protein
MSRWGIDPPDDDQYDVAYDGTACEDCGGPSVAWLCEFCSDLRAFWAAAMEVRMAKAARYGSLSQTSQTRPAVVEVALVPVESTLNSTGVVDVALVPVAKQFGQFDEKLISAHSDARFLKRMAKAILSTDFSTIKEVA